MGNFLWFFQIFLQGFEKNIYINFYWYNTEVLFKTSLTDYFRSSGKLPRCIYREFYSGLRIFLWLPNRDFIGNSSMFFFSEKSSTILKFYLDSSRNLLPFFFQWSLKTLLEGFFLILLPGITSRIFLEVLHELYKIWRFFFQGFPEGISRSIHGDTSRDSKKK